MDFTFCPQCGEKLFPKVCGDEGETPYCNSCNRPFFPFSYPCVICLCIDGDSSEIALIKQGYVSENYVNVAGYVKRGEIPENTAVREVKEEIGLDVVSVSYAGSWYHAKSDNLMLGFVCKVKRGELILSPEVDEACWFPVEKAREILRRDSIGMSLLEKYLFECGTSAERGTD